MFDIDDKDDSLVIQSHHKQLAITADGKTIYLWCDIVVIKKDIAKCWVWNGAYEIEIDAKTKKTVAPYEGGKVCWTGKAPFAKTDYNEAIEWIAKQL
jgi:hypothetical protein